MVKNGGFMAVSYLILHFNIRELLMKKVLYVLLVGLLTNLQAQQFSQLSGVLQLDSKTVLNRIHKIDANEKSDSSFVNTKSPLLAGVLSFMVPGAGEFYSESYLKSILFVALEVAAITTSVIYNKKGDNQTTSFQNFANAHWDVAQYARWTLANLSTLNPVLSPEDYSGLFNGQGQVNWQVLNQLEEDVARGEMGSYYSHRLAHYGEQQYYEMIGKYPQFNPGWEEFGDDVNRPFSYGDPLVQQFHDYSNMRGKANDFYNVATKAVIVVVVNHVVSAVDAALTANWYNKRLSVNLSLEKTNLGYSTEYYPCLNLQCRF
jgi:hypothetical protein